MFVQKLSQDAKIPTRGSSLAAGLDLYAAQGCTIPSQGKALVPTDLKIALPVGTYGRDLALLGSTILMPTIPVPSISF